MDKNAVTIVLLAGLVVAGTAVGMVYVETKRAPETRVRPDRPERQLDVSERVETGPRAKVVPEANQIERDQVQASMIEQQVLADKAKLAALRNNPVEWARLHASSTEQHALVERAAIEASRNGAEDRANCFDSDAKYGADAIYVPGSTRMGGGENFDHCRLGQLAEFSCVENPAGSGRFIPEGKLMDCPSGSSCEEGACVR